MSSDDGAPGVAFRPDAGPGTTGPAAPLPGMLLTPNQEGQSQK